jgi:hypothetical protein
MNGWAMIEKSFICGSRSFTRGNRAFICRKKPFPDALGRLSGANRRLPPNRDVYDPHWDVYEVILRLDYQVDLTRLFSLFTEMGG